MFSYFVVDRDILKPAANVLIRKSDEFATLEYYLNNISIEFEDKLLLPKFINKHDFYIDYIQPLINEYKLEYKLPSLRKYAAQFDTILTCKYSLYDYQEPIVNDLLTFYKARGYINGVIQLTTGFGKTFLALYLANLLKLRTLIIVDETSLANQWIERIKEYFPDIPSIGTIMGGNIDTNRDCRFTIALTQTLNSKLRNFDEEFLNKVVGLDFGLVIFDECHKTSASNKYSRISSLFNTMNVIGLSATPYKYGIHKLQLETSIGPIIISKRRLAYSPELYIWEYVSNLGMYLKKRDRYFINNERMVVIKRRQVYNSNIVKSPIYLNQIHKIVRLLLEAKHKIIIISSTIAQCDIIASLLRQSDDSYIKTRKIVVLHSKSKPSYDELQNADIVIGTYKKCSHGFDKKDISAVIFASPYTGRISIPQIVGRILRETSGKAKPVVIYLYDEHYKNIFSKDKLIEVFKREYPDSNVYSVRNGVKRRLG